MTRAQDDTQLLRAFGVLNRSFLAQFSAALAVHELSYTEGILLANVGAQPGTTQHQLAAQLVVDRAAVARGLKRLRLKGLIQERRSPADRRVKRLHPTESAQPLLREIAAFNRAWIDAVTSELSEPEREQLSGTLSRLQAGARRLSQQGPAKA